MSTDVNALAEKLRSQLLDLGIEANATPDGGSDAIALQLSSQAAQVLSQLLDSSRPGATDSPADQEWEATSERVSEIEGFTGGDSSE